MVTTSFWDSLNCLTICSTTPCSLLRSIGIPPNHLIIFPKGFLNRASFPIQEIFRRNMYNVASVKGKSQLLVWGAPTRTNFPPWGTWPITSHPNIHIHTRPIQYGISPEIGPLCVILYRCISCISIVEQIYFGALNCETISSLLLPK